MSEDGLRGRLARLIWDGRTLKERECFHLADELITFLRANRDAVLVLLGAERAARVSKDAKGWWIHPMNDDRRVRR